MVAELAILVFIVYVRVSSEEQAKKGYSLPEQVLACRAMAEAIGKREGKRVQVIEFRDDVSGDYLERPGLQGALQLIQAQKVDYFLCMDPDRFSRKLILQLLATEQIEKRGVKLDFVQHDYKSTPEGILFYQLRGAISQFEKAKILERTSRGRRGKLKTGGLPYNISMYGYTFRLNVPKGVPAREALVPDPEEVEWVRHIYAWCADEGIGPNAIAARLNKLQVPTKRAAFNRKGKHRRMWWPITVRRILSNRTYATGVLTLNRWKTEGIRAASFLPKEVRRARGIVLAPEERPPEDWIHLEIEPIISPELYERASGVLEGWRSVHPDDLTLTGLGRCGICGSSLVRTGKDSYQCYSNQRPNSPFSAYSTHKTRCDLISKTATAIEAAVWEQVKEWIRYPQKLREALEKALEKPGPAAQPENLPKELTSINERLSIMKESLNNASELFTRARTQQSKDSAMQQIQLLEDGIEALEDRAQGIKDRLSNGSRPQRQSSYDSLALLEDPEFVTHWQAVLDDAGPDRKRQLIRLLVGRFVLQNTPRKRPPEVDVYPR